MERAIRRQTRSVQVYKKQKGQDRYPAPFLNPISYEKPLQEYEAVFTYAIVCRDILKIAYLPAV
jgi:hypothetical protein